MAGPSLKREGCQGMTARTFGLSQVQGKADTKEKRGLIAWITGPQVWGWAQTVAAAGRPEQVGMG